MLGIVFRRHIHWGDVPTWVLAVTTLLALVAAAFAGVVAYELLRMELGRDRRAEQERSEQREADRRAQASRVAAWFGRWENLDLWANAPTGPALDMTARGAAIRNASDLPVYEVRVSFCVPTPPGAGLNWRSGRGLSPPVPIVPPGAENVALPDTSGRRMRLTATSRCGR